MQLHHFVLTKSQLDGIPQAERTLVALLAHAANELGVLAKLFHFSVASLGDHSLLVEARNAQAMTIGRLLTGKIYECWVLLQSAFFATRISKLYEPLFDQEAQAALTALKRYFGRTNLIENVRNKFAFHYELDQISAGYAKLGEGDPLDVYLSKTNANTLYVFAESIVGRSLMENINPVDHAKSIAALIDETSAAIGWLNEVISACLLTCLRLHVGGDLYSLGADIVEVNGAPDWKSVQIPFFIEGAEKSTTLPEHKGAA
jgi:hypothetical protein